MNGATAAPHHLPRLVVAAPSTGQGKTTVATGLMAAAVTSAAQADEVTLKGASCFPIGSPPSKPFEAFVDDLNAQGKGVVQIKMIGGAPAIGTAATRPRLLTKSFPGSPSKMKLWTMRR